MVGFRDCRLPGEPLFVFVASILAFSTAPVMAQSGQVPSTWICSDKTQEIIKNAPVAPVSWDFNLSLAPVGRSFAQGMNSASNGAYRFSAKGDWALVSQAVLRFMSKDREGCADQALIIGTGFGPHAFTKLFGLILDVKTPNFMNHDKVEGNPQVSARRDASECRRTG